MVPVCYIIAHSFTESIKIGNFLDNYGVNSRYLSNMNLEILFKIKPTGHRV